MRNLSPGEAASWEKRVIKDPYNKLVEGIITNVFTDTGYATVRILQHVGVEKDCRIAFQSIGAFCNCRVMPCQGDMVLVAYTRGNRPEIIGYVSPTKSKVMNSSGKIDEDQSRGGYYQLIKASQDGEEWEVVSPGGNGSKKPWKQAIVFRKIEEGEFNYKSGAPHYPGGAEIYGNRMGDLYLYGGPAVLIKLLRDANENQQYADLFRRKDNDSGLGSCSIEERFGTVKRKVDTMNLTSLEEEWPIPVGGWKGSWKSTTESAKEYCLKIKRKVGIGSASIHKNLIEIKYGDVIDNKGLAEYNPKTKKEVRAKLSVYDENDPSGKNCTTFKIDKSGNVYARQMLMATDFSIIGLMATFWTQFKNWTAYITENKKQYILKDDLKTVGGSQTNIVLKKSVNFIGKQKTDIVCGKWEVFALTAEIRAMSVKLGMGSFQKLVNETFLTNLYNTHTHPGVYPGPSVTGPPIIPGIPLVHTTINTEAS